MTIYDNTGAVLADISPKDESYRDREIMSVKTLKLEFNHPGYIDVPVGSYVTFLGETYTLYKPQNFQKNGSRKYDYTLILEGPEASLRKYMFRDTSTGKVKFPITFTPLELVALLVENLNERESGWTVGDVIDGGEIVLSFDSNNCLEALNSIADALDTEWEVTSAKAISLKKTEYNYASPLAMSYGKDNGFRTGVKRDSPDDRAIEILYVQGGDRNINPSVYGSKFLLLPKNQSLEYNGRTYAVDANGLYIRRSDIALSTSEEGALDCSDIYPARVGTITSVETESEGDHFYNFYDTSIPEDLDYSDCIIPGETMTVVFQSGMLTGKEFEVNYSHATRKFEIVPQEIDGVTMPDPTWIPEAGDEYAVFGIQLPDAYVRDDTSEEGASWDMFRQAVKYKYENEDPKFVFSGPVDPIWLRSNWASVAGKMVLGGYILFTDPQFETEGVMIRIKRIKDFINDQYSVEMDLSNMVTGAGFSNTIGQIDRDAVTVDKKNEDLRYYAKRRFRDLRETAVMLADAFANFSGAINPVSVNAMQIILGDQSLQLRFVDSNADPDVSDPIFSYNSSKQFVITLSNTPTYLQHMTLGIEVVSSAHAVSEYKFWTVAGNFASGSLEGFEDTAYYVYAKCHKTTYTDVTFILSDTPVGMEDVTNYYHFLIGILNTEYDGQRSFAPFYGYSEFLPGQITTNMIADADRKLVIDLANAIITAQNGAEIRGTIKFLSGETLKNVTEVEAAASNAQTTANTANNNAIAAALVNNPNLINSGYADVTSKTTDYNFWGNGAYNIELKAGVTYTLSVKGNKVSGTGSLRVFLFNSRWWSPGLEISETDLTVNSITFTPSSDQIVMCRAYNYPSGGGGQVYIEWAMLQEGSVFIDQNTQFKQTAEEEVANKENLLEDSVEIAVASNSSNWHWTDIAGTTAGYRYQLTHGKLYTFSIEDTELSSGTSYTVALYNFTTSASIYTWTFTAGQKNYRTFRVPSGTDNIRIIVYNGMSGSTSGISATFYNLMLQYGPFSTAWKPCMKTLTEALQGSSEVQGGLFLSNLILLRNALGAITAGFSGLDDNITLFGGGTYAQALTAIGGGAALPVLLSKAGAGSNIGCLKVVDKDTVEIQNGNYKTTISTAAIDTLLSSYSASVTLERTAQLSAFFEGSNPLQSPVNFTKTATYNRTISWGSISLNCAYTGHTINAQISFRIVKNGVATQYGDTRSFTSAGNGFIHIPFSQADVSMAEGDSVYAELYVVNNATYMPLLTANFNNCKAVWSEVYKGLILGNDGICLRKDGSNEVRLFAGASGMEMSFMGNNTNLPGVLAAGYVSSGGSATNLFGNFAITNVSHAAGSGVYTCTVNVPGYGYVPMVCAYTTTAGISAQVSSVSDSGDKTFQVATCNSSGIPADHGFWFVIIGDNRQ